MTIVLMDRYVDAILRYRWIVLVLATLLVAAMTAGARFITVTNDYRVLFSEDNPQLLAFDELENTYSTSNAALIAITPRRGLRVHARRSRRGCGYDRFRVARPVLQPRQLPHQLYPQRGVRG